MDDGRSDRVPVNTFTHVRCYTHAYCCSHTPAVIRLPCSARAKAWRFSARFATGCVCAARFCRVLRVAFSTRSFATLAVHLPARHCTPLRYAHTPHHPTPRISVSGPVHSRTCSCYIFACYRHIYSSMTLRGDVLTRRDASMTCDGDVKPCSTRYDVLTSW